MPAQPAGAPARDFANDRAARWPGCLLGAVQALAVMAAVIGFGLVWASLELRAAEAATGPYPDAPSMQDEMVEEPARQTQPEPGLARARTWLIDGYNLLHAGLLEPGEREGAWWSEGLRARVVARVETIAAAVDGATDVWIVFDGPQPAADSASPNTQAGARVVYAACADDWLLARVREGDGANELALVTADRRLAARAERRGARIVAPRRFLSIA
jgi:hypothetical protein